LLYPKINGVDISIFWMLLASSILRGAKIGTSVNGENG
jgi:hypothetical protein